MVISISTSVKNGHLILYLINSNGIKILTLRDNDSASSMVVPGQTYRFEWHVWSAQTSDYQIAASVTPTPVSFPPFNLTRTYNGPHQDMGGFYFTA